jgi:hypothetical protein
MGEESAAHLLAWAAGLYDGEGSCSAYLPRKGRTYRRQMAVSQAGEPGRPPEILSRFKAAVGGIGNITGPYRSYLYYWKTSRRDALDEVAGLLWPHLGEVKRRQFDSARVLARLTVAPEIQPVASGPPSLDAAWAAGFFDGEGSVGISNEALTHRCRGISMEISQSSAGGVPPVLVRFREVVGCGSLSGPHEQKSPWSRLPQYRWRAAALGDVEATASLLWPWLGPAKRAQFGSAIRLRRAGLRRAGTNEKRCDG